MRFAINVVSASETRSSRLPRGPNSFNEPCSQLWRVRPDISPTRFASTHRLRYVLRSIVHIRSIVISPQWSIWQRRRDFEDKIQSVSRIDSLHFWLLTCMQISGQFLINLFYLFFCFSTSNQESFRVADLSDEVQVASMLFLFASKVQIGTLNANLPTKIFHCFFESDFKVGKGNYWIKSTRHIRVINLVEISNADKFHIILSFLFFFYETRATRSFIV